MRLSPKRLWERVWLAALAVLFFQAGEEVRAQSLSSIQAAFVDVGVGARSAALGRAGVGSRDGLASMRFNPAAATSTARVEAAFTYLDQLELVSYTEAGLGFSAGSEWGIGVLVRDSGDDALRETSLRGVLARRVGRLSFGVSAALLSARFGRNDLTAADYSVFDPDEIAVGIGNQIRGEATGFAADVGVQYALGRAAIGVSGRNLLAPVSWDAAATGYASSYTEHLSPELLVGVQVPVGGSGLFLMDYRVPHDSELESVVRAGGEWMIADLLALRAGTERTFNGHRDEGYTFGFGVKPPTVSGLRLSAGYAYASSYLGRSQQFSLVVVLP